MKKLIKIACFLALCCTSHAANYVERNYDSQCIPPSYASGALMVSCTLTISANVTQGAVIVGIASSAVLVAPTVLIGATAATECTNTAANISAGAVRFFTAKTGNTTGAQTVTAAWASPSTVYGSMIVYDVDNADQVGAAPCVNGTHATYGNTVVPDTTITGTTAGNLVVDVIVQSGGGAEPWPDPAQLWISKTNPNLTIGSSYYLTQAGGTVHMKWPAPASGFGSHAVAEIKAASGMTVGYSRGAGVFSWGNSGNSIMEGYNFFTSVDDGGPSGLTSSDIATQVNVRNSNLTSVNHGKSGDRITTVNGIVGRFKNWTERGEHPNFCVIEGGVNDIQAMIAFSSTQYDNLVLYADTVGCRLFIEEVYPAALVANADILTWNIALHAWGVGKTAAGFVVTILLSYSYFDDPGNPGHINAAWTWDGTHLNATGVGKHADFILAQTQASGSNPARLLLGGVGPD